MLVTIHQPEHLPWLGFVNKCDQADALVLLDNVQYRERYFQNRNRILGVNGVTWLTVPVRSKHHREKKICEIEIDNAQNWQKPYCETIRHSYQHHPHYHEHVAFFEDVCVRHWERLAELNEHIIRYCFAVLGVSTPIVRASDLDGQGASSKLLLDLCIKTNASAYLAGQLAGNYLNEAIFAARGIQVLHHHFAHPTYAQYKRDDFSSHLSALDLLMNCGTQSLEIIRSGTALPPPAPCATPQGGVGTHSRAAQGIPSPAHAGDGAHEATA